MELRRINLGCGSNHLPVPWENYDNEIDISKPLPFADGCAQFIFAEHVVEHLTQEGILSFFSECHRVLSLGGIVRIAAPDVGRIMRFATPEYYRFVQSQGWSRSQDLCGALSAMVLCHGHRAVHTAETILALLCASGFPLGAEFRPSQSNTKELRGIEGHGRIIGEAFNEIETVCVEAMK